MRNEREANGGRRGGGGGGGGRRSTGHTHTRTEHDRGVLVHPRLGGAALGGGGAGVELGDNLVAPRQARAQLQPRSQPRVAVHVVHPAGVQVAAGGEKRCA